MYVCMNTYHTRLQYRRQHYKTNINRNALMLRGLIAAHNVENVSLCCERIYWRDFEPFDINTLALNEIVIECD